jgi:2-phospho-L-lactate guanylyltransferase
VHRFDAGVDVLLAVKRLQWAKTRLEPALTGPLRCATVLGMFVDTITACSLVEAVRSITVITSDESVAAAAQYFGAKVLPEPTCHVHTDPLNMALRAGEAAIARGRNRDSVNIAVLQADLPALKPAELAEALSHARSARRSFVPDQQGAGTAALFAFGVELEPRFGANSARLHRRSGAIRLSGDWPGLRRDIDTPYDLVAASLLGLGRATTAALQPVLASSPYPTPREGHQYSPRSR